MIVIYREDPAPPPIRRVRCNGDVAIDVVDGGFLIEVNRPDEALPMLVMEELLSAIAIILPSPPKSLRSDGWELLTVEPSGDESEVELAIAPATPSPGAEPAATFLLTSRAATVELACRLLVLADDVWPLVDGADRQHNSPHPIDEEPT